MHRQEDEAPRKAAREEEVACLGVSPRLNFWSAPAGCRADNLFQTLDQRSLTDEENKIIEQRVRCGQQGGREAGPPPAAPTTDW